MFEAKVCTKPESRPIPKNRSKPIDQSGNKCERFGLWFTFYWLNNLIKFSLF